MRSDMAMLVRSALGYLPLGLLAVSIAAPLTTLLLASSDELSSIVAGASGNAGATFLTHVGLVSAGLSHLSGSTFVLLFAGLLTVAATITLWIELLIRSAAVYVVVLMLPLFFAALVWPARRVWAVSSGRVVRRADRVEVRDRRRPLARCVGARPHDGPERHSDARGRDARDAGRVLAVGAAAPAAAARARRRARRASIEAAAAPVHRRPRPGRDRGRPGARPPAAGRGDVERERRARRAAADRCRLTGRSSSRARTSPAITGQPPPRARSANQTRLRARTRRRGSRERRGPTGRLARTHRQARTARAPRRQLRGTRRRGPSASRSRRPVPGAARWTRSGRRPATAGRRSGSAAASNQRNSC